eukprot:15462755-Alexandrium_andersonii.AAC.1
MPPVAIRHAPQSEPALQTSLHLAGRSGSTSAGSREDLMAAMIRPALVTGPSDWWPRKVLRGRKCFRNSTSWPAASFGSAESRTRP